jgi:hypothetical protein
MWLHAVTVRVKSTNARVLHAHVLHHDVDGHNLALVL